MLSRPQRAPRCPQQAPTCQRPLSRKILLLSAVLAAPSLNAWAQTPTKAQPPSQAQPAHLDQAPHSEKVPQAGTLTFADAVALADKAPQVVAARDALARKREQNSHISRLTNNPQLGTQLGYRREGEGGGTEAQVSLQQAFNLSGYGQAARHSADTEAAALVAEAATVQLRQRQAAAKAWLAVWAAHEALHEAEHEVTVMSDFLTKIEHGAQVGTHTQVDVAEARAYLSEARLQALTIEGEAFDQGVELGRVLGVPTTTPLVASGDPLQPPLPELGPQTRQLLLNRTETLPEVAWRQQQAQAELLRAAETRAQYGTNLQLGAQWVREPNVPYAILGTAQLQLPVFNRGERDRGEQLATAARLRGLAQEAAVTARTELVMTLHEVEHSHELWLQLANHTVPASETTLRLRERLLQVGEGTVLETLLARRAVAAAKGRAARAWATLSLSRYKLWLYWQALGSPQPTAEPAVTPATSTGAR